MKIIKFSILVALLLILSIDTAVSRRPQSGDEMLVCYFHNVVYENKLQPLNFEGGSVALVCSGPDFPNLPEVQHSDAEDVHNEDCFSSTLIVVQ